MKCALLSAVIVALLLSSIGAVGAAEPLSIYVPDDSCANDTVGQRLIYRVKESLRRSATMKVVDRYADAPIALRVVCLEPDRGQNGTFTTYAYSVTLWNKKGFYDYFLTTGVGQCGAGRVADCAESLVARVDSSVTELKSHIQDGSFNPF